MPATATGAPSPAALAEVGSRPAASGRDPMNTAVERVAGRPAWVLPLLLVGPLLILLRFPVDIIDDAYISFRYAWNFAHGQGLVFNPGEHVEGFTNLSWTLL